MARSSSSHHPIFQSVVWYEGQMRIGALSILVPLAALAPGCGDDTSTNSTGSAGATGSSQGGATGSTSSMTGPGSTTSTTATGSGGSVATTGAGGGGPGGGAGAGGGATDRGPISAPPPHSPPAARHPADSS